MNLTLPPPSDAVSALTRFIGRIQQQGGWQGRCKEDLTCRSCVLYFFISVFLQYSSFYFLFFYFLFIFLYFVLVFCGLRDICLCPDCLCKMYFVCTLGVLFVIVVYNGQCSFCAIYNIYQDIIYAKCILCVPLVLYLYL